MELAFRGTYTDAQVYRQSNNSKAIAALAAVVLAACDTPVAEYAAGKDCVAAGFTVSDRFPAARRGTCEVMKSGDVRLTITPEDDGEINNSPWYAFRLEPTEPGVAEIELDYVNGGHRYWPDWSRDGKRWQRVADDAIREHWFGGGATIRVELNDEPIWIAAQEILLPDETAARGAALANAGLIERSVLGESAAGHPIERWDSNPAARRVVLLVGRQHPPEVTGALGMQAFLDTVFGTTALARTFRETHHVVVVPFLNPDGVLAGHWRHNLGGLDLNRDWGSFTQPETRLMRTLLDQLDAANKKVVAFVDFHSTNRNLMYIQEATDVTNPERFADRWIAAARARMPDLQFDKEPRPTSELETSRNYMYKRYGVPSVTYEVGDEEDRTVIAESAAVFAEEFMRLLNDEKN